MGSSWIRMCDVAGAFSRPRTHGMSPRIRCKVLRRNSTKTNRCVKRRILCYYLVNLDSNGKMSERETGEGGLSVRQGVFRGVFSRDPYTVACNLKRPPAVHLRGKQFPINRRFQMPKTAHNVCKSPSLGELCF